MKFSLSLFTVVLSTFTPVVDGAFNRISTFFPCTQISSTCNTSQASNAEIVAASTDGNTLIYTDGEYRRIGFADIVDANNPKPAGTLDFSPGEPTSVAVSGQYALACISSGTILNPAGYVAVIDIATRTIIRNITLPGQPDSIATMGTIAAIAIENERNEDIPMPQLPAGSVFLLNTAATNPANWTSINVNVTGLPNVIVSSDPEPEYVAINSNGVIAVTLQENNALVLINGTSGAVIASYSQGTVNLTNVDISRSDLIINQVGSLSNIERQADGITWIDNRYFATANEGDINNMGGNGTLTGGSRGWSIFDSTNGNVVYDSGSFVDQLSARLGHYPEARSSSKGSEPETVLAATFDGKRHLFVLSERASIVLVYDVSNPVSPVYLQALACSTPGPEGLVAIPGRDLLVVANEVDNRGRKFRSSISIYQDLGLPPTYPNLQSESRTGSTTTFIPFSALSGLAASPPFGSVSPSAITTLYTVEDSFFRQSRILTIEVTAAGPPYKVKTELRMRDNSGFLNASFAGFANVTRSARINADLSVNIDPEGIAISQSNPTTVWVVSEGAGTAAAITLPNQLLRVSLTDGNILSVVNLPPAVNALHISNGFEGVAEYGDWVVIAFQRAWVGETNTRLGLYNYVTQTWKFVFYVLDAYTSPLAGGFVGLSEISSLGNGKFVILERDSNGGFDATIKRLYEVDLGVNLSTIADNTIVTKTLKLDMIPILSTRFGLIPEKVEGIAVDALGNVWVNNDNDGVSNNAGEQQLVLMGPLFAAEVPSASPSAAPKKAPVKAPVVVPIAVPVPILVPPVTSPVAPVPAPVAPVPAPVAPVPAPVAPVPAPVAPVPAPVAPVPAPVAPVPAPRPAPVKAPSAPVKAPAAPVRAPSPPVAPPANATLAPATITPTFAPIRGACGLFGLTLFCPRTRCGLFGRLFNLCK